MHTVAVPAGRQGVPLKKERANQNHNRSRPGKRSKRWRVMSEPTPPEHPPIKYDGGKNPEYRWLVKFRDYAGLLHTKHIRARSIGEASILVRTFIGAGGSILDISRSPIGKPKS